MEKGVSPTISLPRVQVFAVSVLVYATGLVAFLRYAQGHELLRPCSPARSVEPRQLTGILL